MKKEYLILKILIFNIFILIFNLNINKVSFAQQGTLNFENQSDISLFLLEQERKYEKEQAEYIQRNILDRVLGTGRASAVVSVEFALNTKKQASEASESTAERKRKTADVEYLMPGIPNPKAVSQSGTPAGETKMEAGETKASQVTTKLEIQSQTVTIIHDDRILPAKIEVLKKAIIDCLGMNTKRDKLVFTPARFTSGLLDSLKDTFFKPTFLLPLIITLLILSFLFGPFSSFLRNYVTTLKDRAGTEVNIDSKMENPAAGAGGAAGTAGVGGISGMTAAEIAAKEKEDSEKKKTEDEKYTPFTFIDEENLRRVIYLISREPAANIATVLSYLKPEFVREVLVSLPEGLQSEVALELAQAREVSRDEVVRLDSELRQKIDFLVGGLDRLLKVLEEIDRPTRDNILAYLRNEKPDLYERLRKHIFLFEDIIDIPDITLQMILRELKVENIARALRNADEKIVKKFFSNMSTGAASLVKEEMEFGRVITPAQIEEERSKIIEGIKKLESDGKIFIREKPKFVVEGMSDKPSVTEGSAQADEYYNYGLNLYNEGKMDEAVQYLGYCIQVNPEYIQAYQLLGNAYYSLGDYNSALPYFEKALEFNPQDAELQNFVSQLKASVVSA